MNLKQAFSRRDRDRVRIRWKLFAYIMLFVAVILTVIWLAQTVFLESFYKYVKQQQIQTVASVIDSNLGNGDFQSLIDQIAEENNMEVMIYKDGAFQFASPRAMGIPRELVREIISKADAGDGTYLLRFSKQRERLRELNPSLTPPRYDAREQFEHIQYVRRATSSAASGEYVILSANISPVGATVEALRVQLLWITGAVIALTLLLAILISNQIARPIAKTNTAAKALARGAYDVRFTAHGYREIAELNDTLNTAAYELSRVEALRRELLANVSHDLRTPLTMITGFAEMMRDLPGENSPENAQIIVDEANRLTRLVGDLLDLSRLQAGETALHEAQFSLTELLETVVARMRMSPEGERIKLLAEGDAWVEADETQISQVVYNLLANALTYSEGEIEVRQTVDPSVVRVEVRDHGVGIAAEELPYVWDRYYKVEKSHRRARVGTGLGLSIVRGALERHGAKYGVDSVLGEGSVFWFSLALK